MGGRRWQHLGAAALTLWLVTTACTKDNPEAAPAPTTLAPSTTEAATATTGSVAPGSVPTPGAKPANLLLDDPDAVIQDPRRLIVNDKMRDVVRAYVRAEQAVLRALVAPVDPADPAIPATRAGETLTNTIKSVQKTKDDGQAYRAPTVLRVRPTSIRVLDDQAALTVCYTEQAALHDVESGKLLDDAVFSREKTIDLKPAGGLWTVVGLTGSRDRLWKGATECPGP